MKKGDRTIKKYENVLKRKDIPDCIKIMTKMQAKIAIRGCPQNTSAVRGFAHCEHVSEKGKEEFFKCERPHFLV